MGLHLKPVPLEEKVHLVNMIAKAFLVILLACLCQCRDRTLKCPNGDDDVRYFLKPANKDIQDKSPVNLYLDPPTNNIKPNAERTIRLTGLTQDDSFLIQAQDEDGKIVGEFFDEKSGIEIENCDGSDDTAFNDLPFTDDLRLKWRAPASYPFRNGENKTTFNFVYQIKGPKNAGDKQHPWAKQYKVEKSQDLDYYSGASSLSSIALMVALTVVMA